MNLTSCPRCGSMTWMADARDEGGEPDPHCWLNGCRMVREPDAADLEQLARDHRKGQQPGISAKGLARIKNGGRVPGLHYDYVQAS